MAKNSVSTVMELQSGRSEVGQGSNLATIKKFTMSVKQEKEGDLYRVNTLKLDKIQNWLLIKNPKFFSKHYETWSILSTHELIILTKFYDIWRKTVDFLSVANFEPCPILQWLPCRRTLGKSLIHHKTFTS